MADHLDLRKRRILGAIVEDYVDTAEPIGSEWLVARHDFGCRSATLRNEMAEMSDLGYLLQPYTSAGRIPSQRGYRFYVDCLMPATVEPLAAPVTPKDARKMEVEEIVQATCRALSGMTEYPSVATSPVGDTAMLHRLFLAPASARHILLVLLLSTGHVENVIIELTQSPEEPVLQRVTNFLNDSLGGCSLEDIGKSRLADAADIETDRSFLARVHGAVVAAAKRLSNRRVFLEGANHILRQREFQDVLRLDQLLTALEQKSVLFEVFSRASKQEAVNVLIGNEVSVQAMAECSVVSTSYHIAGRTGGFIGVVGPTRMRYHRAVSAVSMMADSLSQLLTRSYIE